jgi:hypothetical protein
VKAVRRHLPSFAWLAIVAMLALAMLPTVSRAMAAQGDGSSWAEICTAQGMKRVALDSQPGEPAQPAVPESASGHLDHCPFCGLSAQAVHVPPAPPPVLDVSAAAGHLPPLFLQAPRTLFAWCRAQPRAPPLNT